MKTPLAAIAFLTVALFSGCDDRGGSLSGSLSAAYDLSFETVRARLYASYLSIEYVNSRGEVVVRLTADRARKEPAESVTVDLTTEGDITGTSGGVEIPRLSSGEMTVTEFAPEQGADVGGRFEAVFPAGSSELDLRGDFSTTIEVVPPR